MIEQINQASGLDPIVQGLSVFLYSIIHRFNDNSEPIFSQYIQLTRTNLQKIVSSRIGVDVFNSRIQRLRESKAFNRSESSDVDSSEITFDPIFLDFLRTNLGKIGLILEILSKSVTSPKTKTASVIVAPAHGMC